ncbi:MAG: hypothetical protein LBG58_12110 [Planctomycetaceae bacterium]|jgi:exonuclease VII small subunit|nr:hypothetical protein [Planctomycetaceae bacterium]
MALKDLSEQLNQLEKTVELLLEKQNAESKTQPTESNPVQKPSFGLDMGKTGWRFFYVIIVLFAFFFGCYVGVNADKKKIDATTITTDTETDKTVKPNKNSELKKIVDKLPASDRQKLSECINKAITSDATEAWELRENLHDNIKISFNDPEEKIWQPFREWIVTKKTIDSYESAKEVYETIKTALETEVKELW